MFSCEYIFVSLCKVTGLTSGEDRCPQCPSEWLIWQQSPHPPLPHQLEGSHNPAGGTEQPDSLLSGADQIAISANYLKE